MTRWLVALLLLLVGSPMAHAGDCPAFSEATPLLEERDGAERLDYLRGTLEPARRNARRWYRGWSIGFASITAAQAAFLPLAETVEDERMLYVGMVASGVGAIFVAASPPPVIRNARRLDERIASGGEDTCDILAEAETMVLDEVEAERSGTSWLMHAGNLLYNVAAGLVLGLAWDQWTDAFVITSFGFLLGEVMIWTRPTDRTRDLEVYRRGTWTVPTAPATLRPAPLALPGGAGLALQGTW